MRFEIDRERSISFLLLIIVFSAIGTFVYHFAHSSFSNDVSDWGDFGSYMSWVIGLVSVFLVYITYNEQRRTNNISQFENSFWNLRKGIELLINQMDFINHVAAYIKNHFNYTNGGANNQRITNSEFICLLGYYWHLHTHDKKALSLQYFWKIESLISYISESKLVDTKSKENHLFTLFIDMNDDESICTLAYLSFCLYQRNSNNIFYYESMRSLIVRCSNLCGNVCDIKGDIQKLPFEDEDIFNFYESKWKEELYVATLSRIVSK